MNTLINRLVSRVGTPRSIVSSAGSKPANVPAFESLEQRQMMALLGVTLSQLPIEFYNATGQLRYEAASGSFDVVATPTSVLLPTGPRAVVGAGHGDFQIHARLTNAGNLARGVVAGDSAIIGSVDSAGNDFVVRGSIDLNGNGTIEPATETGTLLTGELLGFGWRDSGGPTDQYDYKFLLTGGLLAPFYGLRDGGITMTSEASTFTGDFGVDFQGQAKGSVGPIAAPAASSISGYVYEDDSNDGVFDTGEAAIPGTLITLTGVNDAGQPVTRSTMTDGNGFYSFPNLRPGTYRITETQPSAYLDGKDSIGAPGGSTANDEFSSIVLNPGVNGTNNNFGEVRPASVSGYVYADANNDGNFDGSESAIENVLVTLSGTDDLGNSVSLTASTNAAGFYSFGNLRPGTYALTESQPAGYLDGKDTIGTPGGTTANDAFSAISLVAGFNGVNNNFGEILASSISGYVYVDANNDGNFDGSESAIESVLVTLSGTDDLGNSVSLTANTNAAGFYSFGNLRPGTYALTESQPAGYLDGKDTIGTPGGSTSNDAFSSISLPAGFNGVNNNFGELLASSISGYVYVDANNDGNFDGSESAIENVLVTLSGTDDLGNSVSLTASTNAAGFYSFGNLRPGTYALTESQPAGYLDGKDTIGTPGGSTSNDAFSSISLPAGFNGVNNNFGELLASSISGYVYVDANNDGNFDGSESAIENVLVTLSGTDDLGNSVSLIASTNAAGFYSFGNLRPGTYALTESQPAGYLDGKDTIGTPGGSTANDAFSAIGLVAGFNGVNNNFGELLASSISGYVYVDANNDGNFGGGESGIQSVLVTLSGTDDLGNSVSMTASTNAAGFYSFGNLRPGTYALTESQPAGYLDGKDTIGTPGGSTANDAFSAIGLVAGFNGVNNNFGELLASSISGYVYVDANNDGNFGGGESGISGATVTLSGTDDLGNTVSRTTTTNGSGLYTFANLRPGTYALTESQPAGYLDGKDTIGTPGGSTSNDAFSSISLPAGFNGVNNNFGELLPGSISGFVYCDADNNGLKGASEMGIGGVTVRLTGTNDLGASVTITAVTNAAGAFSFTGLRPGTYVLTETQPANTVDGLDRAGSAGGTAGNDVITAIAIGSGQDGVNYLFGEICQGTISGTKYRDLTGNGLSSDDTGMGGVRIYIDANNNSNFDANERSTITAADGTWSFVGVNAGSYTIREVVPAGFIRTFPTNSDNYCVTLTTGQVVTGINFANFETDCGCDITSYSFTATRADGTTATFGNLRGNTNQGDEVVVTFTIASTVTEPVRLTLVSYTAPAAYFDANTASQQRIFEVDTGLFGPGTHTLRVHNPDSYYQIDFVCGDAIVTFGPAGSNIFYTPQGRLISADNDGTVAVVTGAGLLSGTVYFDNNNDGIRQSNEAGIAGTTVRLTFTDGTKTTTLTKKTDSRGFYFFSNLKPGLTYTINESQPLTLIDGIDSVGSLGGNASVNDRFSGIALTAGSAGINYNFGERAVSGNCLTTGDTATIGYWNNNNGQALIKAMNGSQNSTSLGNWLALNFPNLFGANAGTANLTGKTNTQVAAFYKTRFSISGVKIEAQIMAAALACYVTSSSLAGGNYAASYGFNMSAGGTGGSIISVGSAGSLFGIANNASLTVMQYLTIADANASNNGRAWNSSSTSRSTANTLFTNINETGDIV